MKLDNFLSDGYKFSITLDECTSIANKMYPNVNVTQCIIKFWNLGMIQAMGSMTAGRLLTAVGVKFDEIWYVLAFG